MIFEEGPARIIMPDGTEFDVILSRHEITFDNGIPVLHTFTLIDDE